MKSKFYFKRLIYMVMTAAMLITPWDASAYYAGAHGIEESILEDVVSDDTVIDDNGDDSSLQDDDEDNIEVDNEEKDEENDNEGKEEGEDNTEDVEEANEMEEAEIVISQENQSPAESTISIEGWHTYEEEITSFEDLKNAFNAIEENNPTALLISNDIYFEGDIVLSGNKVILLKGINEGIETERVFSAFDESSFAISFASDSNVSILWDMVKINGNIQLVADTGAEVSLDNLCILNNASGSEAISIGKDGNMSLNNVEIKGSKNRAITVVNGTLNIYNSRFENNEGSNGGAISSSSSNLTIENSDFIKNGIPRSGWGGAIYFAGGFADIQDSRFEYNMANDGAAIKGNGGTLHISGETVIRYNEAKNTGGITHNGDSSITGTAQKPVIISDNKGRGLQIYNSDTMYLSHTEIKNNTLTGDDGAGLYVNSGVVYMHSVIIDNNSTNFDGGGIFFWNGAMVFDGNLSKEEERIIVKNNSAGKLGGGIMIEESRRRFTLENIDIIDNKAPNGGGLALCNGPAVNANNLLIKGNMADINGGGIYLENSPTKFPFNYSKVLENTAGNNGGGIYSADRGCILADNVLIKGNKAVNNGGGIYVTEDAAEFVGLYNIAFEDNTAREYVNVLSQRDIDIFKHFTADEVSQNPNIHISDIISTSLDNKNIKSYYINEDGGGERPELTELSDNVYRAYNNYDIGYEEIIYKLKYHLYGGTVSTNSMGEVLDDNHYGSGIRFANMNQQTHIVINLTNERPQAPDRSPFMWWSGEFEGGSLLTNHNGWTLIDLMDLEGDIYNIHAFYSHRVDKKHIIEFYLDTDTNLLLDFFEVIDMAALEEVLEEEARTIPIPVKEGYHFKGWSLKGSAALEDKSSIIHTPVVKNMRYFGQWEKAVNPDTSNPGGGDEGDKEDKVKEPGSGIKPKLAMEPESIAAFVGLEKDQRIPYIVGFPDGSAGADLNITRGQISTALYQLVSESDKTMPAASRFTDMDSSAWYYQAVSYLTKHNIVFGNSDGTFRPDEDITRGEFLAIISRFHKMQSDDVIFVDVSDHWAADAIDNAYKQGWIAGYPDGTFKPDAYLSRAEAIVTINKMLGRTPEQGTFKADSIIYWDLTTEHWAWEEILEASLPDLL